MDPLAGDWSALALLAFLLGARHGLDADHLVTIDGLTRYNAVDAPRLARFCGTLFSAGHGAVVAAVAVAAGFAATRWQVPSWLEQTGAWISIAFLLMLGLVNLESVLRTPRHEVVRTIGVKGKLFSRLQRTRNPWFIASTGALFALSFDTLSQAALFAAAAARSGGVLSSAALALCFVLGMLAADGLNGIWIARLIRRADKAASIASRLFAVTIATLSLAVAALGLAKLLAADLDRWLEGSELQLGLAVIVVVTGAFLLAMRWQRLVTSRAGIG
ncbi:MAG: nickel/cobalt efflux system [Alphaproteobacteria bacterium]|nr:MAG: nickel/cobalt efflux system [Alphaproteobacteria bacterium]